VFETGRCPIGSSSQYSDADARLNLAYPKALSVAEEHKNEHGAVQPEGILDAERASLKYRDAWIGFARLRCPSRPSEAWLVSRTNHRTSILDGSFCDIDVVDGSCAQ